MARTVTLADIRERIRVRYDLPTFTTTTFVTLEAVHALINEEVQRYYGLLLECYGDDYLDTTYALTTSAGVGQTSLPDDFTKLRRLCWLRGADDIVTLRQASVDRIRMGDYDAKSWAEYTPRYRLQGQALAWYPPPSEEYNLTLTYAALPADLAAEDDSFQAGPGHEGFVIYGVCAMIATREEKDPGTWMALRGDAEKRIREQAPQRDESEAGCVRNADRHGRSFLGDREAFDLATFGDW
jgi:hypothetical protein